MKKTVLYEQRWERAQKSGSLARFSVQVRHDGAEQPKVDIGVVGLCNDYRHSLSIDEGDLAPLIETLQAIQAMILEAKKGV